MMFLSSLSVIIPSYNEEYRLSRSLPKIINFLSKNFYDFEVIVIDDGSSDNTSKIAKKFGTKVLRNTTNKGKGYSVRKGVMAATKDFILITDSDLSTPITELSKLLKFKEYDIVIGSRGIDSSLVKNTFIRNISGRLGNLIIRTVLGLNFRDTQCGFKLLKTKVAKDLFRIQFLNRWGFDFEVLFLAHKKGYSIKEVPVKWKYNAESKVKPNDFMRTLYELIQVWLAYKNGKYKI